MANLNLRTHELQRAVEATQRLQEARAGGVLRGEQQGRVAEFNREVLGRAHLVIADMGHELDRLVRRILGQLEQFKAEHLMVGLGGIRFAESKWLLDGRVQVTFAVDRPMPPDPDLFHAVVDPFVDDVTEGLDVPEDVKAELAGFLKGMMLQFAVIKRHAPIDLRGVTFDEFAWDDHRTLRFKIKSGGRTLTPRDIGWD